MAAGDQFLPSAQHGDKHCRPPVRVCFSKHGVYLLPGAGAGDLCARHHEVVAGEHGHLAALSPAPPWRVRPRLLKVGAVFEAPWGHGRTKSGHHEVRLFQHRPEESAHVCWKSARCLKHPGGMDAQSQDIMRFACFSTALKSPPTSAEMSAPCLKHPEAMDAQNQRGVLTHPGVMDDAQQRNMLRPACQNREEEDDPKMGGWSKTSR
jgi:hypothetical protein